jgi:hypothetical protein
LEGYEKVSVSTDEDEDDKDDDAHEMAKKVMTNKQKKII